MTAVETIAQTTIHHQIRAPSLTLTSGSKEAWKWSVDRVEAVALEPEVSRLPSRNEVQDSARPQAPK